MAKQTTSKKTKKKELEKAEVAVPGRKDSIYLLCGLASLAIAFYTLISLLSYLFTEKKFRFLSSFSYYMLYTTLSFYIFLIN